MIKLSDPNDTTIGDMIRQMHKWYAKAEESGEGFYAKSDFKNAICLVANEVSSDDLVDEIIDLLLASGHIHKMKSGLYRLVSGLVVGPYVNIKTGKATNANPPQPYPPIP